MSLYEITLEQSYFGQQVINRWNYQSSEIPDATSGAFKALVGMGFTPDTDIEAFGPETIAGQLQELQSSSIIFVQAIAKNLYSTTDFFTYAFPPGTNGTSASSVGESPTVAMGFTSDRTRSDIRRAQKRFAGVPEAAVAAGGVFESAYVALMQGLGDTMADLNLAPAGVGVITYTPYVFGREKYHPPGKTTWAYKYYDTEAEQLEHIAVITAWNAKPQTRTQTSRQYGRGS
jgi:hypothetical protein